MAEIALQIHPFPPLFDAESRVLILGSFPSVKSREGQYFYHHPQNRFWKVVSAVLGVETPVTIAEKEQMLLRHHIALWDVIASCEIAGSSDSSIRNVVPNDLSAIFSGAQIRAVFCNGGASFNYYRKYTQAATGFEAIQLPSTSPANASWSLERLTTAWQVILPYVRDEHTERDGCPFL